MAILGISDSLPHVRAGKKLEESMHVMSFSQEGGSKEDWKLFPYCSAQRL